MIDSKALANLNQMRQAALDGQAFLQGMSRDDFLADRKTQQAVVMSLMIIGEAAAKIIDRYPEVAAANASIPWTSMRGMRNRIAHGYFAIDMSMVWDTATMRLPGLADALFEYGGREGDQR